MFKVILLALLVSAASLYAQPRVYSTTNAHSHNDYERPVPFYEAYKHQFGSIEADIFLVDGSDDLYVAHTLSELNNKKRSLDSLYLLPLVKCIKQNKGYVYSDTSAKLQLLVDIKTNAITTLNRLIEVLKKYPDIIKTSSVQVVISGNRPDAESFHTYPAFIHFDGVLGTTYSQRALSRISLLSVSFRQLSQWNGKGSIPDKDSIALINAIAQAHKVNKPVRFWAAPDTPDAWKELMKLKVDFINTDRIHELSDFLKMANGTASRAYSITN
jgi:alkaline phosphatase